MKVMKTTPMESSRMFQTKNQQESRVLQYLKFPVDQIMRYLRNLRFTLMYMPQVKLNNIPPDTAQMGPDDLKRTRTTKDNIPSIKMP